jgi:hypothetical protein
VVVAAIAFASSLVVAHCIAPFFQSVIPSEATEGSGLVGRDLLFSL